MHLISLKQMHSGDLLAYLSLNSSFFGGKALCTQCSFVQLWPRYPISSWLTYQRTNRGTNRWTNIWKNGQIDRWTNILSHWKARAHLEMMQYYFWYRVVNKKCSIKVMKKCTKNWRWPCRELKTWYMWNNITVFLFTKKYFFVILIYIADIGIRMSNIDNFDIDQLPSKFAER